MRVARAEEGACGWRTGLGIDAGDYAGFKAEPEEGVAWSQEDVADLVEDIDEQPEEQEANEDG